MDSIITARDFLNRYFPDCDGAMIVYPEGEDTIHTEIIVFYHHIHTHYHKSFNFRGGNIDVKVYRTSNCSFLSSSAHSQHTDVLACLLSQGTIIKDYNHEVETIMAEAQLMHEKQVTRNIPIYKRFEANFFSPVCL